MNNIKDAIARIVENIALQKQSPHNKVYALWKSIFLPEELRHMKLKGEKNGCVFVYVDSSIFLYQINLKKRWILSRLKKKIPNIREIVFTIGKVK